MWTGIAVLLFFGVLTSTLVASAGRWNLPSVWAYCTTLLAALLAVLGTTERGLLRERVRPGPGGKDRYLRAVAVPFWLAHWIVAGLDLRLGWSSVPVEIQFAALAGLPLLLALAA